MSDLANSAAERGKISSILNAQYHATYAANAFELKKIHNVVASIMILQNRTLTILNGAESTLKTAENIIVQAENKAKSKLSEAQTASQTVSQMKVDVVTLKANVNTQRTQAANLKVSQQN